MNLSTEYEELIVDYGNFDLDDEPAKVCKDTVSFNGILSQFLRSDSNERSLKESWIIQALGSKRDEPCTRCAEPIKSNADGVVYTECRTIESMDNVCCGSCKRAHKEVECSFSGKYIATMEEGIQGETKKKLDCGTSRAERYASRTGSPRMLMPEEQAKE